jgi:hypothetical protein
LHSTDSGCIVIPMSTPHPFKVKVGDDGKLAYEGFSICAAIDAAIELSNTSPLRQGKVYDGAFFLATFRSGILAHSTADFERLAGGLNLNR